MHIQLGILNVREIIDIYCTYENCTIFFQLFKRALLVFVSSYLHIIEQKNVARLN